MAKYICCRYPSLRVAYIDEVEEPSKDKSKKNQKTYYSSLVKAASPKSINASEHVQLDEVLVKISVIACLGSVWHGYSY